MKAKPADISETRNAAGATERARVDEQLRFLRRQAVVVFGWIGFTSALAIIHPFGGPETLGFMIMAFACTLSGPLAFAVAWRRSATFREQIMAIDLGPVTLLQTGRILGLSMLVLYSRDQLNGAFALWGGGVDVFIGATAIIFAYIVLAQRPFPRRTFLSWNLLGLFDFIVAWPMLFLVSNTAAGILGGSGPGVEAFFRFPESFIPMVGVPLMACLHLVALMQLRGGRIPNRIPLFHSPSEAAIPASVGASSPTSSPLTTIQEVRHAAYRNVRAQGGPGRGDQTAIARPSRPPGAGGRGRNV
jgi:hypothetical protein